MMEHMGNEVVFLGADFVMGVKPPRRSTGYSGKTEVTVNVPLSTFSSLGSDITKKPIDSKENEEEEASELLTRKIANEMMLESMQKNGSLISDEASKPSDDGSAKTSGSSARNVELAALSDMIPDSFEAKEHGGSGKHLRRMLREGRAEGECSTQAIYGRSFADSKTNSTLSGSTQSGLSAGLSMNEQNRYKAPMDIWHPGFWDEEAEEHVGPNATDGLGGEVAGSTLVDFLSKGGKEISNETSDEDDSSVWSDITGLTGVFCDFPEGRRPIKNEVLRTAALHSIVAFKDKGKTKNPVVSFSLRFGKVVVRTYDRILNDNPACTQGPSIGLGWKFVEQGFNFEDYEMERGRLRRTSELRLNRAQREKLVLDLGYTERDMGAAVRSMNKVKGRRRQTINNLGATKMEEAVENAGRRVKRMLFLRNKD